MWPFKRKGASAGGDELRGARVDPKTCKHPSDVRVSEYVDDRDGRKFVGYHCELCGQFFPAEVDSGVSAS